MGGSRTSSSVKIRVSGTYIGHSGTDFVGIRAGGGGGGGSLDLVIVGNVHALLMDGHLAGTLAGRGRRLLTVKCNLVTAWTERNFENDGLRDGKKCKICLATKNGDAVKQKIFAICENDMHRNWNLGLKIKVSPAAHT